MVYLIISYILIGNKYTFLNQLKETYKMSISFATKKVQAGGRGIGGTLSIGARKEDPNTSSYPRKVLFSDQPNAKTPTSKSTLSLQNDVIVLPDSNFSASLAEELPGAVYDTSAYTTSHNFTLPSASDMESLLGSPYIGTSFNFYIINSGASGDLIVVPGVNGSSLGVMTIVNGKSATLRVRMTGLGSNAAYQVQNIQYSGNIV